MSVALRNLRVPLPEVVGGLGDHLGRRLPGTPCHHLHRHPLGDQIRHRSRYADDDLRVTINSGAVYEDAREIILTSRHPRLLWGGVLIEGRMWLEAGKLRLTAIPCFPKAGHVPELGSWGSGLLAFAVRPLPVLRLGLTVGLCARASG
eukprot:6463860-Amphidinium_carterae.1